jgi:hypothetical protein
VWVTDAQNGKSRHSSVFNQSVEGDFYGPFETVLRDEIDTSQTAALFDQIEAGDAFQMHGESLGVVLFYMSLQLTRTPEFSRLANERLQASLVEYFGLDPDPRSQALATRLATRANAVEYTLPARTQLMVSLASGIYQHLRVMKLFVVRATSSTFFITSDCPVATGPFLDGQDRSLGLRDDAVAFALSPRTALLLCNHLPEHRYLESTSDTDRPTIERWISKINRLISRRSNRWLYSDRNDIASKLQLSFPLERLRTVTKRVAPGMTRTVDVWSTDPA